MKLALATIVLSALAVAQDASAPITVSFSDPARPKMLRANLMNGTLAVTGYDGKDVQIEVRGGSHTAHRPERAAGLRRIDLGGVRAEEENNTIRVHSPLHGNLFIRVPFDTSLKLETMNGGDMKVDKVSGALELSNMNGGVIATNVSGSVVAHSMNGKVIVTFEKMLPDKPMSFSTMNGDVDITLPADARANLRLKSDNGGIYTDFDLKITGGSQPAAAGEGSAKGARYKVKADRAITGTINGGGPDLTLKTVNGSIYLRKK